MNVAWHRQLHRLHLDNMRLLRHRASMFRAPDIEERLLQLEVAERLAGSSLPEFVAAVEWDAPGGYRGDLVFVDPRLRDAAIVETKHVRESLPSDRRGQRLRKARKQAIVYVNKWDEMFPYQFHRITGNIYTNVTGLELVTTIKR